MEKPRVNIIDNSEAVQNSLKSDFEKRIKSATGIDWDVRIYNTCPDDIEELRGGHLNLIDYYLPDGLTGDVVARKMKDAGISGARVLLGGRESWSEQKKERSWYFFGKGGSKPEESLSEEEAFKRGAEWIREGLFQDIMIKPFKQDESSGVVQRLVKKDLIINPVSLGIVGLGRLGEAVMERSVEQPYVQSVKSVDVLSRYLYENDREKYYGYKEVINSDRLKGFHSSLEGLLETNPDILFIATGVRHNGKIPTRIEEFEQTAPKAYEIFNEIIKTCYDGMIVCASNPFEILMELGFRMGINNLKTVGMPVTDSVRTRKLLVKGLKTRGPYLERKIENPNDIQIDVIGSHEKPIPLFSTATVNETPITEYGDYTQFRDRFTMWLRGMGRRVMKGADRIGTYMDAPQAFMEMLSDIAHMRKRPKSCWTVYDYINEDANYNRSIPVNAEYPSLIIRPQHLHGIDSWERRELKKQRYKNFKLQRRLSSDYFNRAH